ncbi:hypothetical protein D3C80_1135210 [compost metagenome]
MLVTESVYLHPVCLSCNELQSQILLPGQGVEYGHDRRRKSRYVMRLRCQFKPTRLNLGNIQNVADQAQQVFC